MSIEVVKAMKPHVVVLPGIGAGHVTPMLELAKRLVIHHACHVTFLHITTQVPLFHSADLPPGLQVVDLPSPDVSAVTSDDTPLFSHMCIVIRETLHSLKPLLLQMQNSQALIADVFCTQAFDICNELSIPFYIFSPSSAIHLAFSLFSRKLHHRDVSGEFLDLPGCSPLKTHDLPVVNAQDDQWFSYHLCRIPMATGIFMNTWQDLEPDPVRAIRENTFFQKIPTPPVHPIGPLVKETEPVTESGEECMTWLDKQASESVLFVALGSGGNLSAEQLTELAWGLELSQQRFLWVVRAPTSDIGIKSQFQLNDPKSYLPEGFLERTKELGMVVPSWAPQVLVLRHRSTAAFLSHCGWNSVLESLTHGVPLIGWPLYADQMVNATAMTEDVGVAIKPVVELGKSVILIGRKEIERVVRVAMEGKEGRDMREKARELKESALKAINYGGTSYEALAGIVNLWQNVN